MGPTHRKMTVFGIAVVSVAMVTAAMVPAASAGVSQGPIGTRLSATVGSADPGAEFWGPVSTNGGGYHVLLGQPTVLPTQTITVPTGHPITGSIKGVTYGLIDDDWFNNIVLNVPAQLHLDPASLPIFISDAAYLFQDHRSVCCLVGFHGVSTWHSPLTSYFFPCSTALEVGDPRVSVAFTVNGYHLQDQAFKSWFAHDVPSEGINGQYTYLNTFTQPSTLC